MSKRTMLSGVIALAFGAAFLIASELAGYSALRIFGAILLAGGGMAIGIACAALPNPTATAQSKLLMRGVACAIAIVVCAPPFLLFGAALTHGFGQSGDGSRLAATGGVVALILLAFLIFALVITIMALVPKPAERGTAVAGEKVS